METGLYLRTDYRSEASHDRLSTIPEESEQDHSDVPSDRVSDYLHHTDPELQQMLNEIPDCEYMISATGEEVTPDELDDRLPLSLLSAPTEELILVPPIELNHDTHVELAVYPPATNMLDLSERPQQGEIVLLQMGANKVRQVVVKRDDDILTPEQLKQHWLEVRQAMLKEVQTWFKL